MRELPHVQHTDTAHEEQKRRPEYLRMYDIPGQEAITERAFQRYERLKRIDPDIVGLYHETPEFRQQQLGHASVSERAALILDGMKHTDPKVRHGCAEGIANAHENDRASLIEVGLRHPDPIVRRICARKIIHVPPKDKTHLLTLLTHVIETDLQSQDHDALEASAHMIVWAAQKDKTKLIRAALENPSQDIQDIASEHIQHVSSADLPDLILLGLHHHNPLVRTASVLAIQGAPEHEKEALILAGLQNPDPNIKKQCAPLINSVDTNHQETLRHEIETFIKANIEAGTPDAQTASVAMLRHLSDTDILAYVQRGLNNPILATRLQHAKTLSLLDEDADKANLSQRGLASDNPDIQLAFAEIIPSIRDVSTTALQRNLAKRAEEHLREQSDLHTQEIGAKMIELMPITDRAKFIHLGLTRAIHPTVQRMCADLIKTTPPSAIPELIHDGLATKDALVQKTSIEALEHVTRQQDALEILRTGLNSSNPNIQAYCAEHMYRAPQAGQDTLRKTITKIIQTVFDEDADPDTQRQAARLIRYTPYADQTNLIMTGLREDKPAAVQRECALAIEKTLPAAQPNLLRTGLTHSRVAIKMICARLVQYAPADQQNELFQLAQTELKEKLIAPPLYKDTDISQENPFQRRDFKKDGSKTTLVGGSLKDKTIVRHILPGPFLAWKKAYEQHETWQEAGFDYVPIEPIQAYRINADHQIDVFSGVLDLSLGHWLDRSSDFKTELLEDRQRILNVLNRLHITHGHDYHHYNFCLRFFRHDDGRIDFDKKPRLYLIDFDQARIQF